MDETREAKLGHSHHAEDRKLTEDKQRAGEDKAPVQEQRAEISKTTVML